GSGSEESVERSEIAASVPATIAAGVPGIKTVLGRAAVSGEIHYNGLLTPEVGSSRQPLFRGDPPAALVVPPEVRLLSGRFPHAGEVMVGRLAARKLNLDESELSMEKIISIGETKVKVSGIFQAPGTVMEAELWADLSDMLAIGQRTTISCA